MKSTAKEEWMVGRSARVFAHVASCVSLVAVVVLTASVAAASDGQRDLNAQPVIGFDGLNHFLDRSLTGASTEPPEQGLCAGGGYVVESVTSLLAVYDTAGNLVKGPTPLNSFFGYPGGQFGPRLTDTSCSYDAATQRFFEVVITLEVSAVNGAPTGVNHVDIAVSQTANPAGAWSIHKLYAQTDCAAGPSLPPTCLGDFPHLGADANGIYITTNDYNFYAHKYRSASVYAFSKHALETDAAAAAATRIDTAGMVNGTQAGFTLWPAQSPDADSFRSGDLATARGGVEFFLSSNAADEVNASHSQTSSDLIVWALSNTQSLDSDQPALHLSNTVLTIDPYAFPPRAQQKVGSTPLADCLNDTTLPLAPGVSGCWRLLHLPVEPAHSWSEGQAIDTGDTRMQQVMFAGGMVYGALDTAVTVGDSTTAGLEWFAVRPHVTDGGDVHAQVVNNGYVAEAGRFLTAPAIAVNRQGSGVIAFSLMGPNDYPSAAYVPFDVKAGTGEIHLAAAGVGPDDGYTNYAAAFMVPNRARWGDYSAASVDGSHVWFASEYIAQSCTFGQWLTPPLATCGGTRAGAANWATRITEVSIGG